MLDATILPLQTRGDPSWTQDHLLGTIVAVLIVAFFLHLAAKFLAPNPRYLTAILTAVVGGILAALVLAWVGGGLGVILAILTWGVVCGAFYRIGIIRAILLGITAGILFWLVTLILVVLGVMAIRS